MALEVFRNDTTQMTNKKGELKLPEITNNGS